jgi:hypothetical protein
VTPARSASGRMNRMRSHVTQANQCDDSTQPPTHWELNFYFTAAVTQRVAMARHPCGRSLGPVRSRRIRAGRRRKSPTEREKCADPKRGQTVSSKMAAGTASSRPTEFICPSTGKKNLDRACSTRVRPRTCRGHARPGTPAPASCTPAARCGCSATGTCCSTTAATTAPPRR